MTDQERKEIIAEVTTILEEKYKKIPEKDNVKSVLENPREKWFRASGGNKYTNSLMYKAFGKNFGFVWEEIRRLTCHIFGEKYVRSLVLHDGADEVCEKICEFIYNMRLEVNKSDSEVSESQD